MGGSVWQRVALTGHRPHYLSIDQREWTASTLKTVAVMLRDTYRTQVGVSGLADGSDLWWATAVLAAGLKLGAYVPFPGQAASWRDRTARDYWAKVYELADPHHSKVFAPWHRAGVYRERDYGMVDDTNAVVAVWLPGQFRSGTAMALRHAVRQGKPGIHLDPSTRTINLRLPTLRELTPS